MDFVNRTVTGLFSKCPKHIFFANFTLSRHFDPKETVIVPNGLVQAVIRGYNNRDKNVMTLVLDVIVNFLKKP